MRVVVTRGEQFDVAEWAPGESPWFGPRPTGAEDGGGSNSPLVFAIVASILVILGTVLLVRGAQPASLGRPLVPTIADLQAVHSGVSVNGVDVRKIQRRDT